MEGEDAWSQKGLACPQSSQSIPQHRQGCSGAGVLEERGQALWRQARGGKGDSAGMGPPKAASTSWLPFAFSTKLHFDQRHSAHFSRVPQASVQLLTRCPGIFLVFIKFHHALTFPQHTKNALGEHTQRRKLALSTCLLPRGSQGGEFSELLARQTRNKRPTHLEQPGRRDLLVQQKGTWRAKQVALLQRLLRMPQWEALEE